jgi:hypothetical protein
MDFSKDGFFTKAVEFLPGGGLITAPFHAAAGNGVHASKAAVKGTFGLASTIAGGGVPGFVGGVLLQ